MRPYNPLNKYVSYSYHHILMVTNSHKASDMLSTYDFPYTALSKNQSLHNSGFRLQKMKVEEFVGAGYVNMREVDPFDEEGDHIILITNGTQDAEFMVDYFRFESLFAPKMENVQGVDSYTTYALEGSMTIIEPFGARFMQILHEAYEMLGISQSLALFICKTVFVGQREDGNVDVLTDAPPLSFYMYDISAKFGVGGATYNIDFVGRTNGVSRLGHYQTALDGIGGIPTHDGEGEDASARTLQDTLEDLFARINSNYQKHYNDTLRDNPDQRGKLIKLEYELVLDDEYKGASKSYLMDQYINRTSESGSGSGSTLMFPVGTTIEQAIQIIMRNSGSVLEDSEGDTDVDDETGLSSRWLYKIHSEVEDVLGEGVESQKRVIRYSITKYEVSYVRSGNEDIAFNIDDELTDNEDVIEYDFIFTGRNVDVIDFDLNMDVGLAFMMSYRHTPPLHRNPIEEVTQEVGYGVLKPTSNTNLVRGGREILMPKQRSRDIQYNMLLDGSKAGDFRNALNSFAGLSALDAILTIRGNPLLIGPSLVSPNFSERKHSLLPNMDKKAGLLRINVKMPTGEPDLYEVYEDFWYRGMYQIITIENKFEAGNFTQSLELLPVFSESPFSTSKEGRGSPSTGTTGGVGDFSSRVDSMRNKELEMGGSADPCKMSPMDRLSTGVEALCMAKDHFAWVIDKTMINEGGYADDPDDSGGATNYGISIVTLRNARWRDSQGNLIGDKNGDGEITKEDMKLLTENDAREIYRKQYWDRYNFSEIWDRNMAYQVFDFGVTSGPNTSVKLLQRSCNYYGHDLDTDGIMGSKTLEVINTSPNKDRILENFKERRARFYEDIVNRNPSQAKFLNGWLRRI